MSLLSFFLSIFVFLFIAPIKAHAYIDPGSGSYMLQFLLALVVGGVVVFRSYLSKLKDVMMGIFKSRKKDEARNK